MPRGRIISPDFWSDGRMVGLSAYARLFYIGTWNFALCDKGHLPDDPVGLKLKILPADQVDAVALLDELMGVGRIVRIVGPEARTFLHVPTFETWQKADTRWKSRCPVCAQSDSPKLTETQQSLVEPTQTLPNSEWRGGDKKGLEKEGEAPPRYCSAHPNGTTTKCGPCKDSRLAFEEWERRNKNRPLIAVPSDSDARRYCQTHWMPKVRDGKCERCIEAEVA